MILSKLYSNKDNIFPPIIFNRGLNIVLGEIRLPENRNKDTHNLGKSTLIKVIDYCLLRKRHKDFFFFKHFDLFKKFIFFLEVELSKNSFITIKRGVDNNTKVSILKHQNKNQNFVTLPIEEWSHSEFPSFDLAKSSLDSLLNLSSIKPWDFRTSISYALRSEYDYKDIFQLTKFKNKDANWKPYIAKVLGLNADYVKKQYELKAELGNYQDQLNKAEAKIPESMQTLDQIDGLILIRNDEIKRIKSQLREFNFNIEDEKINEELVNEIDEEISFLNKDRYYTNSLIKKIKKSLKKQEIIFNPDEAKLIFEEAGVLFKGQIKKTYEQLIQFNRDITTERINILKEELKNNKKKLEDLNNKITELNNSRSKSLRFLQNSKSIEKYKALSESLSQKEARLLFLEEKREDVIRVKDLDHKIEKIKLRQNKNQELLTNNVNYQSEDSKYSSIKIFFNQIIKTMLDKEALISVKINKQKNPDFRVDIIDNLGNETSESDGKTYRKLLCIAFDIAVNKVHIQENFPHFSFHDGFLENLDNRKKHRFVDLIREITQQGYQYIGTLIDSDLPNQDKSIFKDGEIILTLHDDKDGTLFKMPSW